MNPNVKVALRHQSKQEKTFLLIIEFFDQIDVFVIPCLCVLTSYLSQVSKHEKIEHG